MSYSHRHRGIAIRPHAQREPAELDALLPDDETDEFLEHHLAAIRASLAHPDMLS